ncbi:MAG: pilus assembly protein TadG-related protein [Bryobacteraceae bacterium]
MATRNRTSRRASANRTRLGSTSIQLVVVLVPVIFGFLGFAIDLGRLYMIRAELKTAADSMALAAAGKLNGTDDSTTAAAAAAELARAEFDGVANRYDYGGTPVGDSEGNQTSVVDEPQFFDTVSGATGEDETGGGGSAGGAEAKQVRVAVTAQARSLFFRFLPQAQEGLVNLRVQAVAGMSAPLCVACGVEGIAIAAVDTSDTENFGFTTDTRYTLGYVCNGANQPQPLAGTTQRLPYVMLNKLNEEAEAFTDETTQAYRIGANGLPSSTNEVTSCVRVTSDEPEVVWASAAPTACAAQGQPMTVPGLVGNFLCGMATRFEAGVFAGCDTIPEVDAATGALLPDTDVADLDEYAGYTGNNRRIVTVAITEDLDDLNAIAVIGFRQFLVEPLANNTNISPTDGNGRFIALYIGAPAPLRQGKVSGCTIDSGPGKVVLHQ